jgi:hypothetical protein
MTGSLLTKSAELLPTEETDPTDAVREAETGESVEVFPVLAETPTEPSSGAD